MPNRTYESFVFESYEFDQPGRELQMRYSLDGQRQFTETIRFGFDFVPGFDQPALDRALFGLFVISGVSYFKAYLPRKISFTSGGLTAGQQQFFSKAYLYGLGEFFYVNKLDPNGAVNFPIDDTAAADPQEITGLSGSLVPLGGGKDSLVTTEIMKTAPGDFVTWTVNQSTLLEPSIKVIGAPHLPAERTISPELFRANQEGAYNGHVPITAVLAFLSVATAILAGKEFVVLSNESSAKEGNERYRGLDINHQYSKTLEFERDFQEYVKSNITPSISVFSLLRPLSELRIAELFAGHFSTYRDVFSSCNRNFKLLGDRTKLAWCGECPKCAFVFALFAPFVSKAELTSLFGGKNLFTDPLLETTFREMLGLEGHKPFECVGEIAEVRQAFVMAQQTGRYPELTRFEFSEPGYEYAAVGEHAMPEHFFNVLQAYLAAHPTRSGGAA